MTRACARCEFWVRRTDFVGQCRFNPPAQVFDVRNSIVAHWPDSSFDDWCGQFVAVRPAATVVSLKDEF